MYAIRSYYEDAVSLILKAKGRVILTGMGKSGLVRITSYNVCYTKLLRSVSSIDCDFPGGNILVDRIEGDQVFLQQDIRDTTEWWFYCVITSYSIHYTKLYEYTLTGWGLSA